MEQAVLEVSGPVATRTIQAVPEVQAQAMLRLQLAAAGAVLQRPGVMAVRAEMVLPVMMYRLPAAVAVPCSPAAMDRSTVVAAEHLLMVPV